MQEIEIVGAGKHNLKNIDLKLPKRQFIALTGVSGSGKSSLAFDTIFQEGQRRYLESLSIYARQFIKSVEKPEVESIRGISPTISIDQKHASFYYNSSVGTISEVSQYLRLLFARASTPRCPGCQQEIHRYSFQRVLDYVFETFAGELVYILAPVVRNRKGNHSALLERYLKRGFLKAQVNGKLHYLDAVPALGRNTAHNISIMIDAVQITGANENQVRESISLSGFESNDEIIILHKDKEYYFSGKLYCPDCHISLREPEPATFSLNSPTAVCSACKGRGTTDSQVDCELCGGTGFGKESLSFYFGGYNIYELGEMEAADLLDFLRDRKPSGEDAGILEPILPQVIQRLTAFVTLNLGYITMNRKIFTLSGGELQRARLVSQIGFGLSGIIYILDEPSIGMHMSEQENLITLLKDLKDKDNTVVVVEHDESTIRACDYVVDLGPGSGEAGGHIVYAGPLAGLEGAKDSLTADYLFHKKSVSPGHDRKQGVPDANRYVALTGVTINNIANLDVRIPLNSLTLVTGVSGSGKSSLVTDALCPILKGITEGQENQGHRYTYKEAGILPDCHGVGRVLLVEQSAIGKNSRSCPATYINIMPAIRQLFAALTESRIKGYPENRFSYNVKGGRCEACGGLGHKKLEMSFLPGMEVICSVCRGKRYNSETLSCKFKGLSIADVLDLTAEEAFRLFMDIPQLSKKIKILVDVGLGYLRLGQSSTTLSGGEAQRIRLTKELARLSSKSTVYLLDEPTIGLHFADIQKLIDVFVALIAKGNTVVVIEHNMDVIKAADHIIDLGPGGGRHGGRILYAGDPQGLSRCSESLTGRYLNRHLTDLRKI